MHERREHLPSPVKQRILWSSPLKGMEQPVRSFKSFIRTVPPNPNSEDEKPLPPTPSTPDPISTPTSWPVTTPSERTPSVTSWKAPTEWDWEIPSPPIQSFRSTSIFSARKYSPLLPEPIPEDFEMNIGSNPFQQSELSPIQENSNDRPYPPPRNPCRSSPYQTASAQDDARIPEPTMRHGLPSLSSSLGTYAPYPEALRPHATVPRALDPTYRVSDASTKAKAFAALGIGSPSNTKTAREDSLNSPGSTQTEDDASANLILRGKKLRPLDRGNPMLDDSLEHGDLADELQQLSVSQDYHSVLVDQYHEMQAQPQELQAPNSLLTKGANRSDKVEPKMLGKHQELVSQGPNASSQLSSSPRLPSRATSASRQKEKHKKMTSWTPLHHLNSVHKRHRANSEVHQRSASDPVVSRRKQIPESEVDRFLRKDIRLPNLFAHTRGLRSNKRRAKAAETRHANEPSSPPSLPSHSHQERPTPLLRLPGGFALVRQSPSDTPKSQTASSHDVSPVAEIPPQPSNTTSPVSVSDPSQRRSSLYSQDWQVLVAPTVAINNRQRNSIGSPPSLHSRSSTSSPPTSPLAQELSLPRTPPPLPLQSARVPKAPPISLPAPYEPEERDQKKSMESGDDHDTHMHRIIDKARGARDTWRKHQRELKHEKLKQSIKILGPTDPAVVAGYVKREGRRLGHGDAEAGRMPGYLVTGPV